MDQATGPVILAFYKDCLLFIEAYLQVCLGHQAKCLIYFLVVYITKEPGYRIFILLSIKAFTGRGDKQCICQKYCGLQSRKAHAKGHCITRSQVNDSVILSDWRNSCTLISPSSDVRNIVLCCFTIILSPKCSHISDKKGPKQSLELDPPESIQKSLFLFPKNWGVYCAKQGYGSRCGG